MKKKEEKALKEKLVAAVKKVLKDNNALLTVKIEKVLKKSIKQITAQIPVSPVANNKNYHTFLQFFC